MSDSLDDVALGYSPGFTSWVNEVQEALIASGHADKLERWPLPPPSERGVPTEGSTRMWSCSHGIITAGYSERQGEWIALEFSVPGSGLGAPSRDSMASRTLVAPMTARGALITAALIGRFAKTGLDSLEAE